MSRESSFKWLSASALLFLGACSSGLPREEAPLGLSLQVTGSVTKQIDSPLDDAEEYLGGSVRLDSIDLDLGLSSTGNPNVVGLRFSSVNIPKNATITSASIQFKSLEASSGSANFKVEGLMSNSASPFTATTNNISQRERTSSSTSWAVGTWSAGEEGADTTTPNLKNQVQEIINRSGWNEGNALAFVVTGTGKRQAYSADNSVSRAPTLRVSYTTDQAGTTAPIDMGALAAFPGAQGFGTVTKGGRGGRTVYVTNLNDSGTGSLRAALEASGARTVVFAVGGTISLSKTINITNPYITIAGQTAPGDGIMLRATSSNGGPLISISTHDVVVRYLRLRRGPGRVPSNSDAYDGSSNGDNLQITKGYRIVLDHNSFSWGVDESVSTYTIGSTAESNGEPYDVTMSWNIVSESLNNSTHGGGEPKHSKNMLLGTEKSRGNFSIHHNLMAHGIDRNPRVVVSGKTDVINNIAYNSLYNTEVTWQYTSARKSGPQYVNLIGNFYQYGESSIASGDSKPRHLINLRGDVSGTPTSQQFIRAFIGIGPNGESLNPNYIEDRRITWTSKYPASNGRPDVNQAREDVMNGNYEMYQKHATPFITATSAQVAFDQVLSKAGATLPKRDSVDARVAAETRNDTGKVIDSPSQVGGWPTMRSGAAPTDSDRDGMPNTWETARGLNSNSNVDASADRDSDGYTNLEEYLEGVVRGL